MTSFPSIQIPSFPLGEKTYKPQIRTEFEAGYVQSRPRTTRNRRRFTLRWTAMPDTDFSTLATFFDDYQGTIFDWTHPTTSVTYSVRFSTDELESALAFNGHREVTVELEEV